MRFCKLRVYGVAVLQVCCPAFVSTLLYKASVKHYYIGLLPDNASDSSPLHKFSVKQRFRPFPSIAPRTPAKETARNRQKSPCRPSISPAEGFFLPKTPPFVGAGHAPPAPPRATRPAPVHNAARPTNEGPPASIAEQRRPGDVGGDYWGSASGVHIIR